VRSPGSSAIAASDHRRTPTLSGSTRLLIHSVRGGVGRSRECCSSGRPEREGRRARPRARALSGHERMPGDRRAGSRSGRDDADQRAFDTSGTSRCSHPRRGSCTAGPPPEAPARTRRGHRAAARRRAGPDGVTRETAQPPRRSLTAWDKAEMPGSARSTAIDVVSRRTSRRAGDSRRAPRAGVWDATGKGARGRGEPALARHSAHPSRTYQWYDRKHRTAGVAS